MPAWVTPMPTPGLDFDLLDTGCCGMAGTFGLEREHAQLSAEMAEADLVPRLRSSPNASVIANGFSCRAQIRGHAPHQPRHLAQLLAAVLEPSAPLGQHVSAHTHTGPTSH